VFVGIPFFNTGAECEKHLPDAIRSIDNQVTSVEILPVETIGRGRRGDAKRARKTKSLNVLVEMFLRTDATHIFIADADNTHPEDAIERLIRHDVDIASGISPTHANWNTTTASVLDGDGVRWFRRDDIVGKVIGENEIVATGDFCMLAKRRVFERHFDDQAPLRRRLKSEEYGADLHFWIDAQEMGFEARIDGNVVCGHLPEWPLGFDGPEDLIGKKIKAQKWEKAVK